MKSGATMMAEATDQRRASRGGARTTLILGSLLLGLGAASGAEAQEELPPSGDAIPASDIPREETYETTRGMGMGTGARASAVGTSAIAYNPANLSMARLYHAETFAGYGVSDGAWTFGGAIADSTTNRIAAGLSFHGFYGDGDRNYRGFDGRLALGMPLSQAIAIGVSGRYVKLRSRERNANDERVGPELRAFTMDAAIRVTPTEGLHIALLGHNIIRTDSPIAPLLLGGSVSYTIANAFTLASDVFVDLTTMDDESQMVFGFGAEYLVAGQVPLRIGFRREHGRELNQFTAAVGYVDQRVGIDIALRQDIASDSSDTQLLFAFRYHVQ